MKQLPTAANEIAPRIAWRGGSGGAWGRRPHRVSERPPGRAFEKSDRWL